MTAFDEFQRRIEMEERLRRTLTLEDATRRALQESYVGRHLREFTEKQSLVSTKLRDLYEQANFGGIAEQLHRAFGGSNAFQAAIDRLRHVETFRGVDRFANLDNLTAGFADKALRDQMIGAAERYKLNFTLPDTSVINGLAQQMATLKDHYLPAVEAMKAMHTPWLDRTRMLESVSAFSHLQMIGAGIRAQPFELDFTTNLRSRFGDWREVTTVPTSVMNDAVARTDFYIERGFDSSLIEFPEDAFEEATDLAGLLEDVGKDEEVDLTLNDRCQYHLTRI